MGMVFGKAGVAEPVFESLMLRSSAIKNPFSTDYEIRKYGTRIAIEADCSHNSTSSAFRLLAGYIGVGGEPQNEGSTSMSMTAPVVTSQSGAGTSVQIDMTAPVVTSSSGVMQFYLPAEYDSLSKVPKPTNPSVRILEVPPAMGVAHTFNGRVDEKTGASKVARLVQQLNDDGLSIKQEDAMTNFFLWQFNPPFTIPALRRNEIWIPLTKEEVEEHLKRFAEDDRQQ